MSRFSVGNFSSTIPQSFVGEPFCISEILSIGKNYAEGQNTILPKSLSIRRGKERESQFSMEKFLYLSTKNFVGEPFSNSNLSWYRKIFCVGRISRFQSRTITISVGSFMSHSTESLVDNPSKFQKNWSIAKFYA